MSVDIICANVLAKVGEKLLGSDVSQNHNRKHSLNNISNPRYEVNRQAGISLARPS